GLRSPVQLSAFQHHKLYSAHKRLLLRTVPSAPHSLVMQRQGEDTIRTDCRSTTDWMLAR
ncbi:hypothetical protein QQF64_008894, partial [Cirrhinus molitorella]